MTARSILSLGGDRGFTLIEVLIAVVLFSLLSLMLLGGVQLGTRVMERSAARADRAASLSAGYAYLRAQLTAAQPIESRKRRDGSKEVAFDGTPAGVTFISLASPYQAVGGYQRLAIHAEEHGSSLRLVAEWRPYEAETARRVASRAAVLLDGLAAMDFAYFGAATRQEAPRWHDDWQARTRLPTLIRLRIALRDGRRAPDLIIAPRLTPEAP